jgi:hypothetical protein
MEWTLIETNTREPIKRGDVRETFRGERVKVIGFQPPHREGTTGKVDVVLIDDAATGTYYAGVIGAEYIHA